MFDDPLSLGEILGSNDFDRDETLVSVFSGMELQLLRSLSADLAVGYAERAPTLTEYYAARSFMFLLQNGLNSVTGDPRLKKERSIQIDAGLNYETERVRAGINGFYAWIHDYITYENLRSFPPSPADLVQVNLKFVNTDLATLSGGECFLEFDANRYLSPFATFSYVEGRDHSRRGNFATRRAQFNETTDSTPSVRLPGQARGSQNGRLAGGDEEPLPSIRPLEARLGLRFHEPNDNPAWSIELSSRVVDNQDRIATSLGETETPGFTIWDVRGYWQVREHLLLVGGIENFTDKQYREYLDFRSQDANALAIAQPGINFYLGTELAY